jgi:TRAP-type C4-dicarboxylate transport system permease small subunit
MEGLTTIATWMKKGTRPLALFLTAYTAVIGAAMMFLIVADVAGRYLLRHPVPGTMNIVSDYFMVPFIFLPLAYVQYKKEHIVALFFTQRLSHRWKEILDVLAEVFMFTIFFIFGWYTWEKALRAMSFGEYVEETYKVIIWPVHFYLPIGAWALCLQTVADIVDGLGRIVKPSGKE